MFKMQTKPQVNKTDKIKEKKENKSFSSVYGEGVIQCVRYQCHHGKWHAVSDFDNGSSEVPDHIPTAEGGVYDTVSGEYITFAEANRRAFEILHTARMHQEQREEIAREQGAPLAPRNRSEMYSMMPMEEGSYEIVTPFGSSTARAGFFR